MLKLTRLNNHTVAINPDHISWVEAMPDTTLSLINGEKLLVRESLDELIASVIEYRRTVRMIEPEGEPLGPPEGSPPRLGAPTVTIRQSDYPRRSSFPPARHRGER